MILIKIRKSLHKIKNINHIYILTSISYSGLVKKLYVKIFGLKSLMWKINKNNGIKLAVLVKLRLSLFNI